MTITSSTKSLNLTMVDNILFLIRKSKERRILLRHLPGPITNKVIQPIDPSAKKNDLRMILTEVGLVQNKGSPVLNSLRCPHLLPHHIPSYIHTTVLRGSCSMSVRIVWNPTLRTPRAASPDHQGTSLEEAVGLSTSHLRQS